MRNIFPRLRSFFPLAAVAFVIVSMLATLMSGCKNDPAVPPTYNSDNYLSEIDCDSDSVYFANSVLPLIVSSCAKSGCHDRGNNESNVVLTDYNSIIVTGKIKKFKPENSDFYKVMASGSMPPGTPFTPGQLDVIYKWIEQGAQNNHCTSCDTNLLATYSGFVAPLMQSKCLGCHNGNQTGDTINVSTYQGVKGIALSGQLVGTVTGNGYLQMPYQSPRLLDCEINKIIEWVNDGAPNN
ncbi:MAG: hypothetical protein ABI723_05465 [Bacteroidia bacterium]